MTEPTLLQRLALMVIKLVLVAVGAVLALVVLCGVFVLFCLWAVRRAWARLTGRPVAPWVLHTDPMAVWRRAAQFGRGAAQAPPAREAAPPRRVAEDVTDVTPK
ncbi:hypothetical protein [Xylophilus sp. GOD-11R]|uniref:hypothetical protein n=1 Tax=Xylophilus sp. GOD-11R TaxID=3089814 RepID=UPI00298C832E|nr:hypothetical protein [Xylophilus sp. GOD-11R]WPB55317.1 hypothetical protein R9X41_14310 [Xylophilus sp. GOD-11R]